MGIHYDYKSTRGMKAMEKAAKRERKLAEKKAKREIKEGKKKEENINTLQVPNNSISPANFQAICAISPKPPPFERPLRGLSNGGGLGEIARISWKLFFTPL